MPRVLAQSAAHRVYDALCAASTRTLGPRARDPSVPARLAVAIVCVAGGCLVRWLLDPVLVERVPYTIFIASIALATRWGGTVAGVFALALSLVAGTVFFSVPRGGVWPLSPDVLISAPLFVVTAAIVIAALELETRARRQVEERDRLLQNEYQERMRLERELEQAQRLESLGRLAGGVAHDFNNLLTVVAGSAELLRRRHPDEPLLESIATASRRSTELTRQLLSLGRRQMLDLKALSINDAVAECVNLATQLLPEDIHILAKLTPEPWLVEADAMGLQQILLNLVTNARDALPRGGAIHIETENAVVDPRFSMEHPDLPPGDYVLVRVRDSGAGMNEETLRHIFEPFFTTKRDGQGTGLGLSVAYGVAKQLRGHILVSSNPGRGSVFCVYLPRASVDERPPACAPDGRFEREGEPLSVLLVEDNELVRDVVANMLRSLGHDVCVAEDGERALELAVTRRDIEVLLTDVVMPRINGPQLAEKLGAQRSDVSVVFMSGYAENVVLQKGRLGSGLLLKKPFSPAELEGCLRRAVQSKERTRPSSVPLTPGMG